MGCMPYGLGLGRGIVSLGSGFNPSYGLHALRAWHRQKLVRSRQGFNPSYGLHALRAQSNAWLVDCQGWFQSLIWVACPTGVLSHATINSAAAGFNPSYGLHALRARLYTEIESIYGLGFQSLIWVACPTGYRNRRGIVGFGVSIPHMGCMPYGPPTQRQRRVTIAVFQSLIWVACPTGVWSGGRI